MATAQTLSNANAANTGTGSAKTGVAPCALRACEPTSMTIRQLPDRRSTEKRSYALVAELGKETPTRGTDYVLQVLSDSSAPTVLAISISGTCAKGKPKTSPYSKDASQRFRSNPTGACPAVAVDGPRCSVTQPSPVHVEVFPDIDRIDKSFGGLIQHYLIPSAFHPAVYTVQSKKCGGNGQLAARVEVFPRIKVTGKLSLEYKPTNQHHPKAKHADDGWPLALEGAIECQVDAHEWKIGGASKDPKGQDDVSNEFLKSGRRALQGWLKELSEMNRKRRKAVTESNVEFKIDWPKIELEVSAANKEQAKQYDVAIETKINLGCAPLIGAQIDINLLGFLLEHNVVGSMLKRIVDYVESKNSENFHAEIKIVFTVTGKIKGGIEATKALEQPWATKGKIEGKIGLGLEAKIVAEAAAKARGFEVRFGAGAVLHLRGADREDTGEDAKTCDVGGAVTLVAEEVASADGMTKQSRLGVAGAITFNGMAIYYLVYFEVAVNRVDNKLDQDGGRGRKKEGYGEKKNILQNKEKYEGVVVLCEPWSWPQEGAETTKAPLVMPLDKALA